MSNSIYISYSAASKFKSCPQKYYLSKRFQDIRISSAFPFGKAIEKGVDAMIDGKELSIAQEIFAEHWNTEHIKGNEYRQIFDNLDLQFYASDFDNNLFSIQDEEQFDGWADELLDEKAKSWLEVFEEINNNIKFDKQISDAQLAFYNRVIWTCCKIRGTVMLQAFHDDILPQIDLTQREFFASQKEVSMSNSEGDKVTGYLDYILFLKKHGWVTLDLKTAASRYDMHQLDTSEQLKTYVAAEGARIGSKKAGYCVLLKKIKKDKACNKCDAEQEGMAKNCKKCKEGTYSKITLRGETQLIIKEYQDDELDDLLEDYMNVAVAIKNEVNFKNPGNCTAYGRQCEFYDICWKRKNPDEVPHLEDKDAAKKAASEGNKS